MPRPQHDLKEKHHKYTYTLNPERPKSLEASIAILHSVSSLSYGPFVGALNSRGRLTYFREVTSCALGFVSPMGVTLNPKP